MISHVTAASWLGLIDHSSPLIHVSTPRRRTSPRGILVHKRRIAVVRISHEGIPTTTIAQTLLDLAAMGEITLVRRGLARLDYQHRFDPNALMTAVRRRATGQPNIAMGDRPFRPTLCLHAQPTRGRLADLLRAAGHPQARRRQRRDLRRHGLTPVYYDAKLIIELDGVGNHRSPAQVSRDRRNELDLRDARLAGAALQLRPHPRRSRTRPRGGAPPSPPPAPASGARPQPAAAD